MGQNRRLSTQLLLLQLAVVLPTLLLGTTAWAYFTHLRLLDQYGERALAVADSVAAMPTVVAALSGDDPSATLQPLAESVRESTGMLFVVIADADGIRFAHPDPDRLGERVSTDPSTALAGERIVEVDTGTLGRSVRGKSPIWDDGEVIGLVSVGVLTDTVTASFIANHVPALALFVAPALALAVSGSLLLARRFKRLTFGLEPGEIASLLEQRQAMLHGIREGVVGLDRDGRIVVVNEEARRLFPFTTEPKGHRPDQVLRPGALQQLLASSERADDLAVIDGDRVLVASRMPVAVRDEPIGTVVTVRDRTELETLSRELDSLRDVSDSLRAQAHEFDNQLHTLAGLIELGHNEEALALITEASVDHQRLSESLTARLSDATLVALLLSKTIVAAERDVELRLSPDSRLETELADARPIVTVLGNLVDNAIDAVNEPGARGRRVDVTVRTDHDHQLVLQVADQGPGVDTDALNVLLSQGYSTKGREGQRDRGLGLSLVSQVVTRLEGDLQVRNDGGAVFHVTLPLKALSRTTGLVPQ